MPGVGIGWSEPINEIPDLHGSPTGPTADVANTPGTAFSADIKVTECPRHQGGWLPICERAMVDLEADCRRSTVRIYPSRTIIWSSVAAPTPRTALRCRCDPSGRRGRCCQSGSQVPELGRTRFCRTGKGDGGRSTSSPSQCRAFDNVRSVLPLWRRAKRRPSDRALHQVQCGWSHIRSPIQFPDRHSRANRPHRVPRRRQGDRRRSPQTAS